MSPHKKFSVAAIQCAFEEELGPNVARVEHWVREAAGQGAQIILPPELFEGWYFPKTQSAEHFRRAHPVHKHPTLSRFQTLAEELKVAIPVSFFEKAGQAYYNSVAMIGPDGALQGVYRKSHIPDGPGYQEKFYFRQGDTGFRVWETPWATIGVGICWDQWYPEAARAMVLMGADLLFYPTAIGSEPEEPELDSSGPWQRVMQGHAVANIAPVVAANRVGDEGGQRFYGSSFIADELGEKVAELGREEEGVIVSRFDLDAIRQRRAGFGFFRDRRPDLYELLLTADGDLNDEPCGDGCCS